MHYHVEFAPRSITPKACFLVCTIDYLKASVSFQCSFCAKSFLNEEFLKSHILRRHADQNVQASTPGPQRMMANFSVTEQPNMSANNEELLRELNLLTTRLKETESRMIAEREERDRKYEAVSIL